MRRSVLLMRVFSRSVLLSLFSVVIALGASASEPADGARVFIAIADVETGRALVPEGTVVPAGVRFFVNQNNARLPLVFAYAPESRFVEARKIIEAARPSAVPQMRYVVVDPETKGRRLTDNGRRVIVNADPEWIYLYFEDGSYTSALRHVFSQSGQMWYGSGTVAYSAPGSYWGATIDVSLSSNVWWGFDPYGYTNSCTVGSSGGSCTTQYPYVVTSGPFSATVESHGQILQRFPGCWTNPNSQCLRFYSGTIEITFP